MKIDKGRGVKEIIWSLRLFDVWCLSSAVINRSNFKELSAYNQSLVNLHYKKRIWYR